MFGESLVIRQTKSFKLVVTFSKLLADLSVRQTIFVKIFIHPISANIIIPAIWYIASDVLTYALQSKVKLNLRMSLPYCKFSKSSERF